MKIVVTGALGHIGSRLIRELPAGLEGMEILMLDNLLTQRYCSLFNLPATARYDFREADLHDADLAALFAGADAVVHLAAITDAASSFEKPEQVEHVNLRGTERVAQACVAAGCALFFPSTTSVYGTQEEVVDEHCSPAELQPQSPYAESKLSAERYLQEMGERAGLRFAICRLGTIFGTSIGMRFHTAINKFCWQAVMGHPLTVWRTAYEQKRPYLDLGDAISAIRFILAGNHFDGQVYNVLTLNAAVRSIVEIIQATMPQTEVKFVDSRIMNQLSYDVANQRFQDLGFKFSGDLAQGIRDTIALLRQSHSGS